MKRGTNKIMTTLLVCIILIFSPFAFNSNVTAVNIKTNDKLIATKDVDRYIKGYIATTIVILLSDCIFKAVTFEDGFHSIDLVAKTVDNPTMCLNDHLSKLLSKGVDISELKDLINESGINLYGQVESVLGEFSKDLKKEAKLLSDNAIKIDIGGKSGLVFFKIDSLASSIPLFKNAEIGFQNGKLFIKEGSEAFFQGKTYFYKSGRWKEN